MSKSSHGLTYRRAVWKRFVRWFGVIVLVLLNLAILASTIHLRSLNRLDWRHECLSYAACLFFDAVYLLPLIFEVDTVVVLPDKLVLRTLFWQVKLDWSDIAWIKHPDWLAFLVLRTPRCFYLINRRDITEWPELLQTIQFQLAKIPPGITK